jgi:hypothetical protein
MKRRRGEKREERRKDQVELNLLSDEQPSLGAKSKGRRGCGLPFLGGVLVLVPIAIEGLRAVSG